MNKNKKLIALLITPVIILCTSGLKVSAMDHQHRCPRNGSLRESVDELKENGILTEDDVKNIHSYMIKDRQAKEKEMKDKIYNMECEKIDKMVSEKVITKEKGEKLKAAVKANL